MAAEDTESRAGKGSADRTSSLRSWAAVFGIYFVLAGAATWPLAAHLGTATPTVSADSRLTTWIVAWEAHILPSHPTRLFQAPVFSPEADTLALTDHQTALAFPSAPLVWITGNPYLAYNLTLLASIAFACTAAALATREATGSNAAAFIAGAAYGFAPYWGEQIRHIQIVATGWIPMAMFGLLRWTRTWRPGALALTAGAFAMATLTSWYQGVFLAAALAVAGIVLFVADRPPGIRPWVQAACAGALAVGTLVPFAVPSLHMRARDPQFVRTLDEVAPLSAHPSWYLAAPRENTLYGSVTKRWQRPTSDESALFPGLTITALAGAGLFARKETRRERVLVVVALAVLLTGLVLSAGVGARGAGSRFPWAYLYRLLPPFRALRVAARAHMLTVLGLSLLAGFGARGLLRRVRVPQAAIAGVLVALIALEGATAPRPLGPAPRAEPIYASIASRPGAVLEFPVRPPTGTEPVPHGLDVDAMMRATAHWRPLAHGYSGYYPMSYRRLLKDIDRFPNTTGLEAMQRLGVRTLVVRLDRLRPEIVEVVERRLGALAGLTFLRREGPVLLFDVAPIPPGSS